MTDIDQDTLGIHGKRVWQGGDDKDLDVYVKPLEDGTIAVGLFNRSILPRSIAATWEALGLKGRQRVRDVWRQKDLGIFSNNYQAEVPIHGVVLLKISPAK